MGLEGIKLLVDCVTKAKDDALMMSRIDCHAKHVDSIVVRKDVRGRLTRVFLAWPGHRLHTNRLNDELAVGVHDHRYDLSLQGIHGDVRNIVCHRAKDGGTPMREWRFRSGVVNGKPEATKVGEASLVEVASQPLVAGDGWLYVHRDQFHTVECRGFAAWKVCEGSAEKSETTLFTKSETILMHGLYQPFTSRSRVIEWVHAWAKGAATNGSS